MGELNMKQSLFSAFLLLALPVSARAATSCEALAKLSLPHTDITQAALVAKGAFAPPADANAGRVNNPYAAVPAFCRVAATLRPSSDSDIKVEVWLPAEGWNGRFQAVGNGGMWARIGYAALAQAVKEGYAAAATDTGHEDKVKPPTGIEATEHPERGGGSGAFAFGHPEKLVDWGYRSVHEMTVTSKAVIAAYYGSPVKYAYWNSCSTGGREGEIEAEYYPGDYDGLVIGDAANPMTRQDASTIYMTLAVNKEPGSFISRAKWASYAAAVKAKCDSADGVKDGVIENPLACKFDPSEMACKNGDGDDCLTGPQIEALDKILAGPKNPRTGEQIYPPYPVGVILEPSRVGLLPEQRGVDLYRSLFNDPNWDYHTLDFDKDIARADKLGNSLVNAVDETRLKPLFDRGGKILMYHGWSDGSISALQGINYYLKAVAADGGKEKADSSIRLFMIPGMEHCGGGNGTNVFDHLDVITKWVEQGKAPDQIIASRIADGQVVRTRPLCPFPKVAKYSGSGSTDDAANFTCVAP
jgi:feruloyl esterase